MLRSASATLIAACVLGPCALAAEPVRVILFHGGRPWTGKTTASLLRKSGLDVTLVDSAGLDGLGGASIKQFLTDKVEPEPKDEITPAFARLNDFNVVIVAAMLPADEVRFFTPPRIQALRTFVEHGGGLITTENAPGNLNELLPVTFLDQPMEKGVRTCRVRMDAFSGLPRVWPCFATMRKVSLRPGAIALVEEEGGTPHIASLKTGGGRSVYWNAEWRRRSHFKQLSDWAYFADALGRLTRYAAQRSTVDHPLLAQPTDAPPAPAVTHATAMPRVPTMQETSEFTQASIIEEPDTGTLKATLGNGTRLLFAKEPVAYDAFFPGAADPVLHGVRPPALVQTREAAHRTWDQDSAEAVETNPAGEVAKNLPLHLYGWETLPGGGIRLTLKTAESEHAVTLVWDFAPKGVVINEHTYAGFGERARIEGHTGVLLGTSSLAHCRMGGTLEEHAAWRMACYAAPRGFLELPLEEDKTATTRRWQPFGTGQPFVWLVSPVGAYTEFLDRPSVATFEVRHGKGQAVVQVNSLLRCGRKAPPLETPFTWRLFSRGTPRGANAWLGMYQFLRQRYCRQAGWKRPQVLPTSTHTNTCTPGEITATLQAARELGFRWHKLPLCPSAIETLEGPKVMALYTTVAEHGLEPKPWSACAYTQGLDNPVAQAHPEWLVVESDGKPLQYFGCHPVFDLTNSTYFDHYTGVLERAIAGGMRHIYLDMGGAQTAVVNQRGPTASTGLTGALRLYEFLLQRGVTVGIEGMSPLVIDEFWFRKDRYVNHTGREFAFVGMSCFANAPDHLALDYFRLGMHDAFFDIVVSSYAVGMETVPGEKKRVAEIGALNRMFLQAKELVGIPFVRQTPFGTSWTSSTGAALFLWNPVEQLSLDLPEGWGVKEQLTCDGRSTVHTDAPRALTGLPAKSCILIGPLK